MVEPDEPRTYTKREIDDLAKQLQSLSQPGFVNHSDPDHPDPPFVRPINFRCEFLVDDGNSLLTPNEKVPFSAALVRTLSVISARIAQFGTFQMDQ